MTLHIYHASVGAKEFQFTLEMNALTRETFEIDLRAALEETSESMLNALKGGNGGGDKGEGGAETEDGQCSACGTRPATRLLHHTLYFGECVPPRIEDTPQPVCGEPACELAARARLRMDLEIASMLSSIPAAPGAALPTVPGLGGGLLGPQPSLFFTNGGGGGSVGGGADAANRGSSISGSGGSNSHDAGIVGGPGSCFYCGRRQRKSTGAPSPASAPLLRCSKCKVAKYCSAECQKSDWKAHKTVCTADAGVFQ